MVTFNVNLEHNKGIARIDDGEKRKTIPSSNESGVFYDVSGSSTIILD